MPLTGIGLLLSLAEDDLSLGLDDLCSLGRLLGGRDGVKVVVRLLGFALLVLSVG